MQTESESNNEVLDIKRILNIIIRGIWIVFLTTFLSFLVVFAYLRYASYLYQANSLVLIQPNSNLSTNFGFGEASLSNNVDLSSAQIELFKSRGLLLSVVNKLNLDVEYTQVGVIKNASFFCNSPIIIQFDTLGFSLYGQPFRLSFNDENENFKLTCPALQEESLNCKLGQPVTIAGNRITFSRNPSRTLPISTSEYLVTVAAKSKATDKLRSKLSVQSTGALIYLVSFEDENRERAAAIVNTLAEVFLQNEIIDRRRSLDQTLLFIDTLLQSVSGDVSVSKKQLQKIEQERNIPVYQAQRETKMAQVNELEGKIAAIDYNLRALPEVARQVANSLSSIETSTVLQFVPLLDGITSVNIRTLVTSLNALIQERNLLLERQTLQSPLVRENSFKIYTLKQGILAEIQQEIAALNRERDILVQEGRKVGARIATYPGIERDLSGATKSFGISEELFFLLQQKKTEIAINRAGIVSESKVLTPAVIPSAPKSPKSNLLRIGSIVFGLFLGLFIVIVREATRSTVRDRGELEKNTTLPVIAEINEAERKVSDSGLEVFHEPRSAMAESFRALRGSVLLLLNNKPRRIIAVTSTISGEGKSFVSMNLAGSLTMMGKDVLLVDLDLRKPRLHVAFDMQNDKGVTDYLLDHITLDEAIQKTGYKHLDFITAGTLAPNPAELLGTVKFLTFLEEAAERYDYVVLDTSPVGLVVDGVPVISEASVSIYIVRANYSSRQFLKNISRMAEDQKLSNLYLALNCVDKSERGYGYGYGNGSGYYVTTKPASFWWRLRKRFIG